MSEFGLGREIVEDGMRLLWNRCYHVNYTVLFSTCLVHFFMIPDYVLISMLCVIGLGD